MVTDPAVSRADSPTVLTLILLLDYLDGDTAIFRHMCGVEARVDRAEARVDRATFDNQGRPSEVRVVIGRGS